MRDPILRDTDLEGPARDAPRWHSEDDLVRQLMLLDAAGARAAAGLLARRAIADAPDPRQASYLLFDLLCRADRAVSDAAGLPRRDSGARMALASRLAGERTSEELFAAFLACYHDIAAPLDLRRSDGHPAVELVKEFVRRNYARKLTLAEIAQAVRISRNYLSHLFRRHCKQTVTEFLHRTRMKEAESLLASGERTVSQIAYLVGYQNYRDFHRNFVRYAKTSPKKFRQVTALTRRPPAPPPP